MNGNKPKMTQDTIIKIVLKTRSIENIRRKSTYYSRNISRNISNRNTRNNCKRSIKTRTNYFQYFELKDEYHDYEMALEEFDDILTMSNDHDPLFQITQARPITPKNDEFYKQ